MTTTTALIVIVPLLPPSANHAWVSNGRGGKVLSDEYLTFRQELSVEARQTARLTGWTLPDGPLQLTMLLTFGSHRKADIDNRIKTGLDSLAVALGFDDARVGRIVIERAGVEPGRPLCELILEPWEGRHDRAC